MIRVFSFFLLLMFFFSGKIFAQQKEDFVMYAKDSSVEIQNSLTAKQIPDSIGLSIEKISILNATIVSYTNKLNSITYEQDYTDQLKKEKIHAIEIDFFKSISELLTKEEFNKFLIWYKQVFKNPYF
jgi:hypothetical protein